MAGRTDHYAVLGVPTTATTAQVKAAYRRLARRFHPDTNAHDPEGERRFKAVARAYEVLGSPASRRALRRAPVPGPVRLARRRRRRQLRRGSGPIYHSDLGHHSDFYQGSDPLSVGEAARLVGRDAGWLRRAIRSGRLAAVAGPDGYLLRRRDVERLDRTAPSAPIRTAAAREPETDPTPTNRHVARVETKRD